MNNRRKIILVYSMGKVGSSTVYELIKGNSRNTVIHLHKMGWNNLERSINIREFFYRIKYMVKLLLAKLMRAEIEIFVGYRNPVDRIISAYFQNLDKSRLIKVTPEKRYDYLRKDLIYKKSKYIKNTSQWFDKELRQHFSVSINDFIIVPNQNYFLAAKENKQVYLYSIRHVDELMRNLGYLGEIDRHVSNVADLKWYSDYKKAIQTECDDIFSFSEKKLLESTDVHELFQKHKIKV